jgi:hypothetical protein
VSARGAQWGDEAGFADGAEEALRGAEHLGGPAHGVGGVVVVETPEGIELSAVKTRGGALAPYRHQGPEGTATPSAGPSNAPAFCFRVPGLNAAGGAGIADV